jgi:uncharacterized protein (DUF433 family)
MAGKIIQAFTEDQVTQLTGITAGQLRYWDRTGFFEPEYAYENRRDSYSRIYSYLDLVALKVIARLRKHVPLRRLRVVKERLAQINPSLWRGVTLWVDGREVAFVHPQTGEREQVVSGQKLMSLDLKEVTEDLDENLRALSRRDEAKVGTVERHRRVMHNSAVIGGTRIPVAVIRSFAQAGYTVEQIIAEYPSLTARDVERALKADQAA